LSKVTQSLHNTSHAKFRIVRARTTNACRYFGPFAHQQAVRRTLNKMRKKFGIPLPDSTPTALPDGTWKLYNNACSEIQKHANVVTAEEYATRVTKACAFLEGKVES
jgi:excinuclease UvrABC nuclease subunit